jgi:glycosyltransferase involved in cell wall biosynthesis
MRILYFSPRDCWPVDTGARLRDFHLARELARREPLTYLGFDRPGAAPSTAARRTRVGAAAGNSAGEIECVLLPPPPRYSPLSVARGFIGPDAISVLNYSSDAMRTELGRLLSAERFDAVQVEGVHLSAYLPVIQNAARRPMVIVDWHNIESELLERYSAGAASQPRRIYTARTAQLLKRAEAKILAEADAHVVCSERERLRLTEREPRARIRVIGNGVDVNFYAGTSSTTTGPCQDLAFVGSMDYLANIDAAEHFARQILPALQTGQPQHRFIIVGARPTKAVQALAELPGVVVTGTVEDVRPYYRDAFAVVVPLRIGGGTRLKILEAMAAGVPVISTRLGAEGLDAVAGVHFLEAESAEDFRVAIRRLADSGEWQRLAAAGLELVRSRYDWAILGESLHRFYREILPG